MFFIAACDSKYTATTNYTSTIDKKDETPNNSNKNLPGKFANITLSSSLIDTDGFPLAISWGSSMGADDYEVIITQDSKCVDVVKVFDTKQTNVYINIDLANGTYYVCVKAVNENGKTASDQVVEFSVNIPSVVLGDFIINPIYSAPNPIISWSVSQNASHYSIVVSAASISNCATATGYIKLDDLTTYQTVNLTPDTLYTVCVKSESDDATAKYAKATFTPKRNLNLVPKFSYDGGSFLNAMENSDHWYGASGDLDYGDAEHPATCRPILLAIAPTKVCGKTGTISQRIENCKEVHSRSVLAPWYESAECGNVAWELVSVYNVSAEVGDTCASNCYEVWMDITDPNHPVVWSEIITRSSDAWNALDLTNVIFNWCQAAGTNSSSELNNPYRSHEDPSGICDSSSYQNITTKPISLCYEDPEWLDTPEYVKKSKANLPLEWYLPTSRDFAVARSHGIIRVVPWERGGSVGCYWTSTIYSSNPSYPFYFHTHHPGSIEGLHIYTGRKGTYSNYDVRCAAKVDKNY